MTAAGIPVPGSMRLRPGLPPLLAGLSLLAVLWAGAVPGLPALGIGAASFSAHMIRHMGIVAVAAPLIALGLARLVPALPHLVPPGFALAASFAEFAVVWGWHAPLLHDAARASTPLLILEQGSFLAAGLGLWLGAVGAAQGGAGRAARAGGIGALLLTSMHMTLLGALLLLGPRPLYAFGALCRPGAGTTPLEDQALGGVIMLLVGGAAYLIGALALLGSILGREAPKGTGPGREAPKGTGSARR